MIGAFAITSDPILIALGLGLIGAMFVRSLTVYLVRQGTLSEYVYLEHGAHWAIGALAFILMISIGVHISEFITGLIGVAFIGASFLTSIRRNKTTGRRGRGSRHRARLSACPITQHLTTERTVAQMAIDYTKRPEQTDRRRRRRRRTAAAPAAAGPAASGPPRRSP